MNAPESSLQKIKADIAIFALKENKPVTTFFVLRMFLLTTGFQFVFARRLQDIVVRIPLVGRLLRRILWWLTCLVFSSELALGAEFAGGLYMPHPYGIVVGVAKVGRNVTVLQGVTIGKRGAEVRGPVIEDDVELGAGAVILGAITLGANSAVGANSVLLQDLPPNSTAIGAPAKIRPKGERHES